MPKNSADSDAAVRVGTSDAEAALKLLAAEQDAQPGRHPHQLLWEVVQDLNAGIFLVAAALGGITVFWNVAWGLGLLAAAVVAFVALAALPESGLDEATHKVRASIERIDLTRLPSFTQIRETFPWYFTVAVASSGVSGLFAFISLLYSLIDDGTVQVWAIAVMFVASLIFCGVVAASTYREFLYYSRVAAAHDELMQELAQAASEDRDDIELSPSQLAALSKAESHQTAREVKAALSDDPAAVESAWSIVYTPEASDSLARLSVEKPDAWTRVMSAILSLQQDPWPSDARVTDTEHVGTELHAGHYAVNYRSEEDARCVYVLTIMEDRGRLVDG